VLQGVRRRPLALAAVCTLLFLTFLDNTIVSVALGDIQRETHAGIASLQWIVNGYALVFAAMMLPAGALGDRIGQRPMMLGGAAVFVAGSLMCAVASTSGVLIAGRAVMGLGAAASEPATLAMLRHLYPGRRERARATGVWAAVAGLALALGPVIGALIVGLADWHWIFWFNLAFGAVALTAATGTLPYIAGSPGRRIDVGGAVALAAALALLVFGVTEGESAGYSAAVPVLLFVIAAVAAAGFGWRLRRAREPLLDPAQLRKPAFIVSNLVAFAVYFGTFAVFFFCALYLSVVVKQSGLQIAAQFAPMMTAMIVASLLTGRWLARTGARQPMAWGCLLFAAGLLATDRVLGPNQSYLPLAATLTLAGIGIGITVVPTTFTPVSVVPLDRVGMASSAVNTSREIGAVAGTAVLGAIVNASLVSHLDHQLDQLGLAALKSAIIPEVLHGGAALTAGSGGGGGFSSTPLARKLLESVYAAFYSGLHVCLVVSAVTAVVAAAVVLVALRPRARVAGPTADEAADAARSG
jgi:EmrB/QacA subfamily drug resistance transporter